MDECLIVFETEFDNYKRSQIFRNIFFNRINNYSYLRCVDIRDIFVNFNCNFEIALSIINYRQNELHECCNYNNLASNSFDRTPKVAIKSRCNDSCYFCAYIREPKTLTDLKSLLAQQLVITLRCFPSPF